MNKKFLYVAALAALLIGYFAWQKPFKTTELSEEPGESEEREERGKSEKPTDWFMRQRAYPEQTVNISAYREAVAQAQTLCAQYGAADEVIWSPAGPSNIGGRITAIGVHPSDPNTIYIGAADGGVLKSTDAGVNWTPIFDATASLSIGDIAVDPANANTVWVGTGEANTSGDSYPGDGIYRSTNGGQTWQNMGLPNSHHIGRIAIDPTNPQRLFVAATGALFSTNPERGVYRTTNGGQSWERVLYLTDSTAAIDVLINPQNPQIVFAAMWERIRHLTNRNVGGVTSGIWRSTDGGTNWTNLTTGLPPSSPTIGRIGLTMSPTNTNLLYAVYSNHPGDMMGVWKTTNGGDTWTAAMSPPSTTYNGFGWYFGQISVDPVDVNKVYVLGVPLLRSTNGGSSWFFISSSVHADHHALWVNPNNTSLIYDGNDGGFYKSLNGGTSWTKSYNLHISQFYDIEIDELLPQRLYGGTQDNGTLRTLTGSISDWTQIFGGDGFKVEVDFTNSNIIFCEYQYGQLQKSTNGGTSFSTAMSGINQSDRFNWDTPFVMDPTNHNTLYFGTHRIYKTTNAAGSWTAVSNDLTDGPSGGNLVFNTITTLAVAPTNGQVVYAGTDDANVWVSQNGGTSWTQINAGLPDRWVTRVAVSPQNAGIVYATLSGYRIAEPLAHVYRSTNYGSSWQNISGNLPEAPVNCIIEDPANPQQLFIATDVGIYYTTNLGTSWAPLGTNLPVNVILDLKLHHPTRKLVAGCHGRSMYSCSLDSLAPPSGINVTLTPVNPPIVVPANGGSFNFNAAVVNTGPAQQSFSVWAKMRYPDGAYTPPTLGPVTVNPPVGITISRLRIQSVPGTYPPGQYYYIGYAALVYPGPVVDSSFFTFTKSATSDGGPVVTTATCGGELFPGERSQTAAIPAGLELAVSPNPFNPATAISYKLQAPSKVSLKVYDAAGRLVATLVDGMREAGTYQVMFDGSKLASGVYMIRMESGKQSATLRATLTK
jgi:photosystem II stability/assembly factor-like uncharacterized protein